MSMTKGAYKVTNAQSKSKELIKYALYIIISGFIAFYMKGTIDEFAEYWDLPLRGDLLTTMISIAIGLCSTTIILYFYERSVKKSYLG